MPKRNKRKRKENSFIYLIVLQQGAGICLALVRASWQKISKWWECMGEIT
jgi:hypothetical protein